MIDGLGDRSTAATSVSVGQRWMCRWGAALAFFVPFWVALSRASSVSDWQSDGDLANVLSGVVPLQGVVSNLLAQSLLVVPIGTCALRAASVSAIALGVVGHAVFSLTRGILSSDHGEGDRAASWFSLLAALTATLCASALQMGASMAGGSVAAGLAFLALEFEEPSPTAPANAMTRAAAALGALLAEDARLCAPIVIALFVRALVTRSFPAKRTLRTAIPIALTVAAILLAPVGIRSIGLTVSPMVAHPSSRPTALGAVGPLGAFAAEFGGLGTVALFLSVVGLALGLGRRRNRFRFVPLATIVLLDFVVSSFLPEARASLFVRPGLRLLSLSSMAIALALTFQEVCVRIGRLKARTTMSAVVFLGMFDAALVATRAEQATFAFSASEGADQFIDEALERLPSSAVVIVRSEPLYTRLLGAQLLSATRPDIAIVPYPNLSTSRATMSLLRARPFVADIVRDLSIYGHPLERSLASLADSRPTFVELEPAWDRKIASHLVPEHLWFRFTPEPRGVAERRAAASSIVERIRTMLSPHTHDPITDPRTAAQLVGRLREYRVLASDMGDREQVSLLTAEIDRLEPSPDPHNSAPRRGDGDAPAEPTTRKPGVREPAKAK